MLSATRFSVRSSLQSTNVGPNAAMLSAGGQLTDIGAWYLAENATGVAPDSAAPHVWGRDPLILALLASWMTTIALLAAA